MGRARPESDIWIMSGIFHRMREMYRKDGGAFPDPILNLPGTTRTRPIPNPEELAKDMNGRALADLKDETGAVTLRAGQLLDGFAQLRDDGTTSSGCWIFSGCYHREGQPDGAARRDGPARAGYRPELGLGLAGQPANSLQPRQRRPGRQSLEPEQAGHSSGTAADGSASTCPTMRRRRSPPTRSVRSS